jgi:Leucine-rich repeat (LRR) protein
MEMNGYIPSEIALLGDLVELILNANDLTGSLPQELFDLRNLEEMYLSDNALTGNLPSTFKEGNYNLRVLDLSENNLEGTLPPELFVNMPNLEFVFLASKNYSFTGTFPTEIGLLKAIIELDLGNNRLSGSLPTELAFLTNLRMLNLKENFGLNGMVPIEFSKLENLDFLHLEGTYLENLDESFCEISEEFEHFSSECGGDSPRVSCSCCTHCWYVICICEYSREKWGNSHASRHCIHLV